MSLFLNPRFYVWVNVVGTVAAAVSSYRLDWDEYWLDWHITASLFLVVLSSIAGIVATLISSRSNQRRSFLATLVFMLAALFVSGIAAWLFRYGQGDFADEIGLKDIEDYPIYSFLALLSAVFVSSRLMKINSIRAYSAFVYGFIFGFAIQSAGYFIWALWG